MKQLSKLIFILISLLPAITAFAQANGDAPAQEEEFNIFLFSLLFIFLSIMCGAAIIGAMAATLLLFFLLALMTLGVLSTSVAIGLHRRSFSAGFKSFLMILFGSSCAIIGGIGILVVDHFVHLPMSTAVSLLTGFSAGLTGGLVLAVATYRVYQWLIRFIAGKLHLG